MIPHDSDLYWPIAIKDTIKWFPFLSIMEHTANLMKTNKGIIPSLLKAFSMFELRLIGDKEKLDFIAIKCINYKKATGLHLQYSTFEEMITKFVLNSILHHVGMVWIISSNDQKKYEIDKINHQDWLNKGTWYNIYICSRLHGSLFEDFITHARTDRYNIMCSLVAHDKKLPDYEYDEINIGDRLIPKHSTTEALEALGATLNFIDICLKMLEDNYDARHVAYITARKDIFKQIPLTMIKSLTPKQKVQRLMT